MRNHHPRLRLDNALLSLDIIHVRASQLSMALPSRSSPLGSSQLLRSLPRPSAISSLFCFLLPFLRPITSPLHLHLLASALPPRRLTVDTHGGGARALRRREQYTRQFCPCCGSSQRIATFRLTIGGRVDLQQRGSELSFSRHESSTVCQLSVERVEQRQPAWVRVVQPSAVTSLPQLTFTHTHFPSSPHPLALLFAFSLTPPTSTPHSLG